MVPRTYTAKSKDWVKCPVMNHDMEDAFADEVLAELAAQRARGLTAKEVQRRTGITNSTWGNYFVQRTTRIPFSAMLAVSDVLGVLPEDMIGRARVRAARNAEAFGSPSVDRTTAELEAGLSRSGRRALDAARAAKAAELAEAGEGDVDPRQRARADVDDGIVRTVTHWGRTG